MKTYKSLAFIAGMACALSFTSCVEDETTAASDNYNVIKIEGFADSYTAIAYSESISITPTVTGTKSGTDDKNLTYTWYLDNGGLTESVHKHITIGNEKNLNFKVDLAPATYTLCLRVKDSSTGLLYEERKTLNVVNPFVRGFYLCGEKEDGTAALDFVGMIVGRDTVVINDIFDNTANLKNPVDCQFSGACPYSGNEWQQMLWIYGKDQSIGVETSASLDHFGVMKEKTPEKMLFPTLKTVQNPMQIIGIAPSQVGSNSTQRSRSFRLLMTRHEIFATSMMTAPEAYGNPINRSSSNTSELFEFFPYLFYKGSYTSAPYAYIVFDTTNKCFRNGAGSYAAPTNFTQFSTDDGSVFFWDQNQYSPVRELVYGENGYGLSGRSYALMNDGTDSYVYEFTMGTSGSNHTKNRASTIDKTVATDFDQASKYAFFSLQPIVFYAVGSKLYAYNYVRSECQLVKDFQGSEITYIGFDYNSANRATDFIVATYSNSAKGEIYKYTVADDPNAISVEQHSYSPWKTNLKVVKVEYRNSTF